MELSELTVCSTNGLTNSVVCSLQQNLNVKVRVNDVTFRGMETGKLSVETYFRLQTIPINNNTADWLELLSSF